MLEADDLLVKCPQCGAWPMAWAQRNILAQREVSFDVRGAAARKRVSFAMPLAARAC